MKSPVWVDSGTYKLSNPDTLVITGQLGPGTWNRVWAPATKSSQQPPGAGTCGLLTEGEAGDVLRAPVSGALDHRGSGDCIYKSLLSSFDKVSIKAFPARRQAWYITRKTPNPNFVDVPGVGEDAYIEHVNTGAPVVKHPERGFRVPYRAAPNTGGNGRMIYPT
ncbi:MAG: hypothetical protein ACREQ3_22870 [Candidatus Binatia bacterium]